MLTVSLGWQVHFAQPAQRMAQLAPAAAAGALAAIVCRGQVALLLICLLRSPAAELCGGAAGGGVRPGVPAPAVRLPHPRGRLPGGARPLRGHPPGFHLCLLPCDVYIQTPCYEHSNAPQVWLRCEVLSATCASGWRAMGMGICDPELLCGRNGGAHAAIWTAEICRKPPRGLLSDGTQGYAAIKERFSTAVAAQNAALLRARAGAAPPATGDGQRCCS